MFCDGLGGPLENAVLASFGVKFFESKWGWEAFRQMHLRWWFRIRWIGRPGSAGDSRSTYTGRCFGLDLGGPLNAHGKDWLRFSCLFDPGRAEDEGA